MKHIRSYNPVMPISLSGKILVSVLRSLYGLLDSLFIFRWRKPWKEHHEDPAKMSTRMQVYLGYKYYYRAMVEDETHSNIKEALHRQSLRMEVPADFIPMQNCTIHAGGDLIPYRALTTTVCRDLWDDVGDFFFGADIVAANLESPADFNQPYAAAPEVMLNDMYFNIDENTWRIFNGNARYTGFDILSVANNHSLDQGIDGLLNTMAFLEKQGIAYTGAAKTPASAYKATILDRQGLKTGFVAATFSFNKRLLTSDMKWLCPHIFLNEPDPDVHALIAQAEDARLQGADIIIAMLHMGCAYQAFPGSITRRNIHQICDETGIDIIIAGHPHHAQPVEFYHSPQTGKQHIILYSLGDFIAFDIFKWGHLSLLAQLQISKGIRQGIHETRITNLKLKPVYMHSRIEKGKVKKLKLLDYKQLRQSPAQHLKSRSEIQKWNEVSSFFEEYIFPDHQQHLLI